MDIKHLYVLNPQQFTEEVHLLSIEPDEAQTLIGAILPDQTGHTGQFLQTDGTNLSWQSTGGGGFITSVANTSAINLSVIGGQLTASFSSLLISQFTNDSGYITSAGVPSLPLSGANGGTGVANTGFTITLAGNLTTTGAFNTTLVQQFTGSITLPNATSTLMTLGLNESVTGIKTFSQASIKINNPAGTFAYTIQSAAITAARTLNLPLITGSDTLATLGLAQTFTAAQTFQGATNLPIYVNGTFGTYARLGINHASNTGFGLYIGGALKWSNAVVNNFGGSNVDYLFYNEMTNSGAFAIDGNTNNVYFGGGGTEPTAIIHLAAGQATAKLSPLKFTAGTNLTTAEAGAMEYNGTNLFFTRTGTTRENVLIAVDNATAPTTTLTPTFTSYYGGNTNALGDPNRWISVNILGSVYKIPLYT